MIGSFSSYEVGRRALQAQRRALDVAGHNIANATTPGYSRQRLILQPTPPYTPPSAVRPEQAGQVGTGVYAQQIQRFRDAFLDRQFRQETGPSGYWETRNTVLKEIESMLVEPSDAGLHHQMSVFFKSWAEAADLADAGGPRSNIIQVAHGLTDMFFRLYRQYDDLRQNLVVTAQNAVNDVNQMAREIAALNKQIARALGMGDQANDLMDRRDYLIDQMSSLATITIHEDSLGAYNVYLDGVALVHQFNTNELGIELTAHPDGGDRIAYTMPTLGGYEVPVRTGELAALAETRDGAEPSLRTLQQQLNELAQAIADEVNALHSTGYDLNGATGVDFFVTGTTALDFKVNPAIQTVADLALASRPNEPGNGEIALLITELAAQNIPALGSVSFIEYYSGAINRLGVASKDAQRMQENQGALIHLIENQRQAVSAVSIDEEMVNAMLHQHGYNAASRFITVIDDMIDKLINFTGMVGR